MKTQPSGKLGSLLQTLAQPGRPQVMSQLKKMGMLQMQGDRVLVTAFPKGDVNALKDELVTKGMLNATVSGNVVTGGVPMNALSRVGEAANLRLLRPTLAMRRAGLTNTQGDRAQRSDLARRSFNVDGRGVRVGVLSDSYNCSTGPLVLGEMFTTAVTDMANNDLPLDVQVLKDLSTTPSDACADEGRAMMQLIHDVAPGASFSFYTAVLSEQDFADGIIALADAGAQVIVDDVGYLSEPYFLDGVVAQAADKVAARGIPFFSAAGNDARNSYEARYRGSQVAGLGGGPLHDFAAGSSVDTLQTVTVGTFSGVILGFQWDQPWRSVNGVGSASDLDIYFLDNAGVPLPDCSSDFLGDVCQVAGVDPNVDGDPLELPIILNFGLQAAQVQLAIEVVSGPAPSRLKYIYWGNLALNEFDTRSSTSFGHPNADGAAAVGAAAWFNTADFNPFDPRCVPGCIESYSSAGGLPILFNTQGERLGVPRLRLKPEFVAPDGGNTSFFVADLTFPLLPAQGEPDGFPNFFGTSAAAPHAAGVAALMLDQRARDIAAGKRFIGPRRLTPEFMYLAMQVSARNLERRSTVDDAVSNPIERGNNFDFDSGFGLIDAEDALRATRGF